MTFGFIVLRHVNSELTNNYWNECIQCIRRLYPLKKIVVIDDNSKKEFIRPFYEYKNVEYIQSEFPQRGELLPYYYFHKHRFFDNAVIIHDSVFIHKRINFDLFGNNIPVMPLWHFKNSRDENYERLVQISRYLNYSEKIQEEFKNIKENKYLNMAIVNTTNWNGCFGVQTYINHGFLDYIQKKYNIFNMLKVVKCRKDRCCLERILGLIISMENSKLKKIPSLFGDILTYTNGEYSWGYTYHKYKRKLENEKKIMVPYVKVWTGR
jgi:hypothetical protein